MDWQAIQFAVTGTRVVALSSDERLMVLRRVQHKMLRVSDPHLYPPPGKVTVEQMAKRLGTNVRMIERLKAKLLPAVSGDCPVCGCQAWVLPIGVVEEHPDSLMNECPLSGMVLDELDEHALLALSVQWLAGWLRSGDGRGVANHYDSLSPGQRRTLFIATLAAVPDAPAEALFAWLEAS